MTQSLGLGLALRTGCVDKRSPGSLYDGPGGEEVESSSDSKPVLCERHKGTVLDPVVAVGVSADEME